jgi:hypothetical protein
MGRVSGHQEQRIDQGESCSTAAEKAMLYSGTLDGGCRVVHAKKVITKITSKPCFTAALWMEGAELFMPKINYKK